MLLQDLDALDDTNGKGQCSVVILKSSSSFDKSWHLLFECVISLSGVGSRLYLGG